MPFSLETIDRAPADEIRGALAAGTFPPELLPRLLQHSLALVRSEALDALAASGAADAIAAALADREPTLRLKAVQLLAGHAPGLGRALRNPDPDVRETAFRIVLASRLERRPQLLLVALGDRDSRRRRQALEALVKPRLEGWREALVRASADAPALLDAVTDGELAAAIEDPAARTLLRRRGERVLEILPIAASGAAMDLAFEIAPARAAELARRAWPRLTPAARARALDRGAADELLRECADDPDASVRRVACRRLLRRGDWASLPVARWIELLETKVGTDGWEESDLAKIVRGLGEGTEGMAALVDAARGPYVLVRRAAAEILRRRGAVEELAQLAETDDPGVLKEVAIVLGERTDPRGLIPLVRATQECRRTRAAELLARYPEARTFDFLLAALRHRRGSVRLYGAEKLERSVDERAIEPLLGLLDDPCVDLQFACVRALSKFAAREAVWPRFVALLEYGDLSVRQASIEGLGAARVVAAVPALIRLLANPFLRARAADALKQVGDRKGYLAILRRQRRDAEIARQKERILKLNARRR